MLPIVLAFVVHCVWCWNQFLCQVWIENWDKCKHIYINIVQLSKIFCVCIVFLLYRQATQVTLVELLQDFLWQLWFFETLRSFPGKKSCKKYVLGYWLLYLSSFSLSTLLSPATTCQPNGILIMKSLTLGTF